MFASRDVLIENITILRGERCLLNELSFCLRAGELTLVTGQNGVGKSSLLQTIAGLLSLAKGRIKLADVQHSEIRYIGHHSGCWPRLTVEENCKLITQLYGGATGSNFDETLSVLGLTACRDQLVETCSAGQKQRLALSLLMTAPGKLWLLDEPWTALDLAMQASLWTLLEAHLARGGFVCLTSHQPIVHNHLSIQEINLSCRQPCH